MSVSIRNLSHVYSQNSIFEYTALMDISLDVGAHDFIGIIGHTGSGKSTFIQHLNRLLVPTTGTVVVNNIDINKKGVLMKDIVRRVGIVFQYPEYQLFEETVYKDVAFGPKNIGFSEEKVDFYVRESLGIVGLDFDEIKDVSPFDLSGGQKRRVAIAGVLAMKPPILILDEPTSGLDPMGRIEILDSIKKMNKEKGICIFLVSHSMDDVAEYAEKIMVFNEGRVEMFGAPSEVFADSERMNAMGLDVPQSRQLLEKLKSRGVGVSTAPYTTAGTIKELLGAFKQGKPDNV